MSRKQLTAKQYAFLTYLRDYLSESGIWPTYREVVDHFGYLQALNKKGYLRRTDDGFELIEERPARHEVRGIPVKGIISAGRLQEAVEEHLGTITLETLFPNLDRIFAIRVSGQSMQGADIHDGDYVLLMDEDIPNGGIGAVLYDGETSLKRIYYDRNGLRLEPANEAYRDIHIKPDVFEEVRILGRYVGHVNRTGIYRRTGAAGRA